jgi:hypothetical protein
VDCYSQAICYYSGYVSLEKGDFFFNGKEGNYFSIWKCYTTSVYIRSIGSSWNTDEQSTRVFFKIVPIVGVVGDENTYSFQELYVLCSNLLCNNLYVSCNADGIMRLIHSLWERFYSNTSLGCPKNTFLSSDGSCSDLHRDYSNLLVGATGVYSGSGERLFSSEGIGTDCNSSFVDL